MVCKNKGETEGMFEYIFEILFVNKHNLTILALSRSRYSGGLVFEVRVVKPVLSPPRG